jgi:hypothetical protein
LIGIGYIDSSHSHQGYALSNPLLTHRAPFQLPSASCAGHEFEEFHQLNLLTYKNEGKEAVRGCVEQGQAGQCEVSEGQGKLRKRPSSVNYR